ncbi:MAG: cyclically-permuted mutarotase family protein [Bacteroidaceae bacterium]|nr:cyclically-permuted mutarotase family protein [Bacteroidaceae bacterium]
MRYIFKVFIILPFAAALTGCCKDNKGETPVEKGYEQGVSALYGALHNNIVYVAGGCNFPETPAAEGGSKRYYKWIYKSRADETNKWEKAGELPQSSAYGVSVQKDNKWYIAGGMNEEGSHNSTYRITLEKDFMHIDTLPPLPCTVDNATGCITDDNIFYVAGGNADGKASARIFALNLCKNGAVWEEMPPMPQPRVQPVCAAAGKNILIWGGFCPGDTTTAKVHTDGIMYDKSTGCSTAIGTTGSDSDTITLSGGTAINGNDGCIYATGGVNKEIFFDAITGSYKLIARENYMTQPVEWYRFNGKLLKYNINEGKWSLVTENKEFARAGALLLNHKGKLIYIGGELKPGIRTPEVHTYKYQ